MFRCTTVGLAAALAFVFVPLAASAERAWVKDEVKLNIRSGPGTQYRILGVLTTGESVELLARGDGWTQVRGPRSGEGWIPAGFLQGEPPARILLERHEAETGSMKQRYETLSKEVKELRSSQGEIEGREATQRAEIDRLTSENVQLRAGARWPHWVAGASIFFAGSLIGIIVHWSSGRRSPRRIRL